MTEFGPIDVAYLVLACGLLTSGEIRRHALEAIDVLVPYSVHEHLAGLTTSSRHSGPSTQADQMLRGTVAVPGREAAPHEQSWIVTGERSTAEWEASLRPE